jgi:hypothetical protein
MKTVRNAFLASVLATSCIGAVAADAPQASIPFMSFDQSIHGWQADGQQAMWIQDVRKQWYYAKLQAPCNGLEFAVRLGFDTKTYNTLDRYSYVIVPNEARCAITSLTRSDPPPGKNGSSAGAPAGKTPASKAAGK